MVFLVAVGCAGGCGCGRRIALSRSGICHARAGAADAHDSASPALAPLISGVNRKNKSRYTSERVEVMRGGD